jgi:3-deoxy-manno-octulosonate cytidylyltransferase (CMP-KDO synthetase)
VTRVVAVVPARLASSRYPDKPLVPIAGLPMVEHVRRRAALAEGIDGVVVATCDERIRETVEGYGGHVVMTAATHQRATDRVAEAARSIDADVIAMVQGDEPLLVPETVARTVAPILRDADVGCTNLLSRLAGPDDARDPDIVKAACARSGDLLFLTRATIPYMRQPGDVPVYRQTGIMALRCAWLAAFSELPETPLERAESIDMLRLLEHGRPIRGVVSERPTVGVDRPDDVAIVERALREEPDQRALWERIR